MIFDVHAHLISDDHERYPPAPLSGALRPGDLDDPMTAERLLREMDAHGVERAALVQRGHVYGFDTRYVCDAAARYPDRFVAVCSIDALNPAAPGHVRHWVGDRGAAGIRMMEPRKGADMSWFVQPAVWQAATDAGVPVCVHFFSWNRAEGLPALMGLLRRFPKTDVIVDHFTNMDVFAGPPDHGFDRLMTELAMFPRVVLKFTTLPLGPLDEKGVEAAPVVERVVSTFGADRVSWGSDIAQSKGTYGYMVELGRRAVAGLPEDAQRKVQHDVAASLYGRAS